MAGNEKIAARNAGVAHGDKGLKANAIGFWDGLAIGLDSTAPAYSLAAVLGSLVAIAGTQAPAIMLVSFVPIFLIAGAFFYMNRADQDCGTTFSWVTRAMGPTLGWLGGWAIFTTGVLVIGSLADVAALYTFELFGLTSLARVPAGGGDLRGDHHLGDDLAVRVGTELSAKVQRVLVLAQVAILLIFVVAAWSGSRPETRPGSRHPGVELAVTGRPRQHQLDLRGVLLAVFIYWGWESAVNLTEESTDSATIARQGRTGQHARAPGDLRRCRHRHDRGRRAGNLSPSTTTTPHCSAPSVRLSSGHWPFLLVLAIITSGLASTQTTILPASRTSLSMAVAGAFPKPFAKVHPKYGTPAFGTWVIGIAAIVWYVGGQHLLRELPVRFPVRILADDRVLLRPDRHRLRDLLAEAACCTR